MSYRASVTSASIPRTSILQLMILYTFRSLSNLFPPFVLLLSQWQQQKWKCLNITDGNTAIFNLRIQVVWDMKLCRWVVTDVSKESGSLVFMGNKEPKNFNFYLCFKEYCTFRLVCCTDQILALKIVVIAFTTFELFPETAGVFMYLV